MARKPKSYKIGDLFTTQKSKVTGVIAEIVPVRPDLTRVRLDTPQGPRWTTFTVENMD